MDLAGGSSARRLEPSVRKGPRDVRTRQLRDVVAAQAATITTPCGEVTGDGCCDGSCAGAVWWNGAPNAAGGGGCCIKYDDGAGPSAKPIGAPPLLLCRRLVPFGADGIAIGPPVTVGAIG